MRFSNKHLIINNTLGASFNSDSINLEHMLYCSIQAVITTPDAVGEFKLQVSLDGTTWIDYPFSAEALAGIDKNIMWDISSLSARYLRVVYTSTGGGGVGTVCNIKMYVKGFNAS